MQTLIPRHILHAPAAICAMVASSAQAQPVSLSEVAAVDRAGNAVVTVHSSDFGRETALLLDASGQLVHCRTESRVMAARARLDADGFLFAAYGDVFVGDSTLERWDARGNVDWTHAFRLRPGDAGQRSFEPTPDGGAVLVEEVDLPSGGNQALMVRLGVDGAERWQTPLYIDPVGIGATDFSVDRLGRIAFAAASHPLPLSSFGTVRLGMVGPDGHLAWLHAEAHGSSAASQLLDDGNGDFWWHVGTHPWRGVPYRPSQLVRWTPWGMPLASFEGPALVAGSEILQPAAGNREAIWYLAFGWRDLELVRLGTAGIEARHAIDARREPRPARDSPYYWTLLSVAAEAAWVAVSRPAIDGGPTVERYTRAGRAWSRRLQGLEYVHHVMATENGDARVLTGAYGREPWLVSLSPRSGEELWRVSLSAAYAACAAR